MVWIGRSMQRPPPQVDEGTVNSLITVIPTGHLDYPHWWAAQKKFIRRVGCRVHRVRSRICHIVTDSISVARHTLVEGC